jgi:hypothetical protein
VPLSLWETLDGNGEAEMLRGTAVGRDAEDDATEDGFTNCGQEVDKRAMRTLSCTAQVWRLDLSDEQVSR